MSTLEIRNLTAQVRPTDESTEPKEILKGVNLTINSGETHAIMGPNGSGKSTLSYTLAGHPKYEVTGGEVLLDGENLLDMELMSALKQVYSWLCSTRSKSLVYPWRTSCVLQRLPSEAKPRSYASG